MSDLGPLIESLEADVARLQAELARVKAREAERVKRAFVEAAEHRHHLDFGTYLPPEQRHWWEMEADRRLAEGKL